MNPWLVVGVLAWGALSAEEEKQKKKRKKRKKKAKKKATKRLLELQGRLADDSRIRGTSIEAILGRSDLDPRVRARLERHR